jgi:hypothetical protein
MARMNRLKSWWFKISSFMVRSHVANKCGHRTKRAGWAEAFGERYFVEMPLAENGRADYCLGCIGRMAIRCAWCGDAIHIGNPVTLYTPMKKDFVVPDHAVRYSEKPLQLVGCLGWNCADTGGDRAGFWMPPGEVHRVPTVFEQLMGSDDSDAVVIADLRDPHNVGTVVGKGDL